MTNKTKRVRILEDVSVNVGRGFVEYKKGWSGPVVEQVFEKLIAGGKAEDLSKPVKGRKGKSDDGGQAT